MRALLWWLGVIVGAFALAALVRHGLALSLTPRLGATVDAFDSISQAFFAKVYAAFAAPQDHAGEFELHPYAKDIFLVLWLFFLADIRGAVEQRRWLVAIMLFVWGTLIALAVSLAVALEPLASPGVALVAFPALGITLHQTGWCLLEAVLGRSPGESAAMRFLIFLRAEVLPIALGASIAVVTASRVPSYPPLSGAPEPAVAVLVAMFAALALFHVWRGAVYASLDRDTDLSWSRAFGGSGSTRLALFMLSTFAGAALFFVIDALLPRVASQ